MRRLIFAILALFSCEGPRIEPLPSSMPTAITPVTPPPIVLGLTGPADGDLATAATVNGPFQDLQNDVEAFRLLTYGGGFKVSLVATSDTVMTIQPLGAIVVQTGGIWKAIEHSVATTIDPLALAGGAFAASTRYYVYASIVAGVLTFSVSTTAPDAGRRYKTGDVQYQFITTFCTTAFSVLIPYSQVDSTYLYAGAIDGLLTAGNATVSTNVPLNYLIPSGARIAKVVADTNITAAGRVARLIAPTIGGTVATIIDNGVTANQTQADLPLTYGASFNYLVSDAAMTLDVAAYGFVY